MFLTKWYFVVKNNKYVHKFGVTAMLRNVLYGCINNAVKLRKLNVWLVLEHVNKCLHVSVKVHPCCVQSFTFK